MPRAETKMSIRRFAHNHILLDHGFNAKKRRQVKMLLHRLQNNGIAGMGEEHAEHALQWCPDDLDKAYDLLVLVNESFEGELKEYNPNLTMQGAINRNMVTCYLDALLFAMFACLDSFEAMLYNDFNDEPRKKLAGVLRLWVNLLRTGWLIRTDLVRTKHPNLPPVVNANASSLDKTSPRFLS